MADDYMARPVVSIGQKAYEARRDTGMTWDDIAKLIGSKSGSSAYSSARVYALRQGLPSLRKKRHLVSCNIDRAQVAAFGARAELPVERVLAARLALADADEALQAAEQRRNQCRRDLEEAREIQRRAEVARG